MQAMTVQQLADAFGMSLNTVRMLCKCKGSPAFKAGSGERSPWRCDPEEFRSFLVKKAERSKG